MGINKNPKVEEYINSICSKIKNSKAHKEIKEELLGHIEDAALEYQRKGATEDEAVSKAIAGMGDAEIVGYELNKVHKIQPEWSILIMTILFAVIGLCAMYFIQTKGALHNSHQIFNKSLAFTLIGSAIVFGLYFFDYRKIQPFSKYIYIGTLIVLSYVVYYGTAVNGLRAWLSIGPISFNFVEISLFLFIISLAGLFDNWNWDEPKNIIYGLALAITPEIFMLKAPSTAICTIYSISIFVLMIISGIKLKHSLLIASLGIGLSTCLAIAQPYRIERILTFINPNRDPESSGWMNIQLSKITHSAGLLGQGFTFNMSMLPDVDVHTRFIFTYIVYTFGWLAGIILLMLITTFLIRIARITLVTNNQYGKLLVSGFATIFIVQFLWNILMNLSLAPISGVGLPFISFGGSQFIGDAVAVGIITNIYKWKNTSKIIA